mmetsp:Transcript_11699/g.19872  ORF Transcript_11699/g.19872 Transcript_11699/m.19872 type:complete len:216 (+) Transcript_11699:109-756(+)
MAELDLGADWVDLSVDDLSMIGQFLLEGDEGRSTLDPSVFDEIEEEDEEDEGQVIQIDESGIGNDMPETSRDTTTTAWTAEIQAKLAEVTAEVKTGFVWNNSIGSVLASLCAAEVTCKTNTSENSMWQFYRQKSHVYDAKEQQRTTTTGANFLWVFGLLAGFWCICIFRKICWSIFSFLSMPHPLCTHTECEFETGADRLPQGTRGGGEDCGIGS